VVPVLNHVNPWPPSRSTWHPARFSPNVARDSEPTGGLVIEIYGSPRTSAGRCYLMLEELGIGYHTKPLDMMEKREHKAAEYLAINPNGKVPTLVDGDVTLWESLAINQYLCDKYRPELLGRDAAQRGRVTQWNFWAMLELQPPLIDLLIQLLFVPEDKRDAGVMARAREQVPTKLKILDDQLQTSPYLTGAEVTVADFNVGTVFHVTTSLKYPTEGYAHASAWYQRLRERPSFAKWIELRGGR
jgi:glutathione S-transferase